MPVEPSSLAILSYGGLAGRSHRRCGFARDGRGRSGCRRCRGTRTGRPNRPNLPAWSGSRGCRGLHRFGLGRSAAARQQGGRADRDIADQPLALRQGRDRAARNGHSQTIGAGRGQRYAAGSLWHGPTFAKGQFGLEQLLPRAIGKTHPDPVADRGEDNGTGRGGRGDRGDRGGAGRSGWKRRWQGSAGSIKAGLSTSTT